MASARRKNTSYKLKTLRQLRRTRNKCGRKIRGSFLFFQTFTCVSILQLHHGSEFSE